jgi:GH15 family glucan-1,4-alpha-glucosidase
MCWVACDRLSRIATRLGLQESAAHWRHSADGLRDAILARAWNDELGCFVGSLDGDQIDASVLLLHDLGIVSPCDERFVSTVQKVGQSLGREGHLLRYVAADDFGPPTVAFTSCTFWYVDALAAIGQVDEARRIFSGLLANVNHVGLLSEDLDPGTGELWGNFPQTYSMAGLIVSAMRLSKGWEEAR